MLDIEGQMYPCESCGENIFSVEAGAGLAVDSSPIIFTGRENIKFLWHCIHRLIEGDDIDIEEAIAIVESYGFVLNNDLCIEEVLE